MQLSVAPSPLRETVGLVPVILASIDRLSDCIESETQALREGAREGLDHFTHLKNVGLLDLTRAMRLIGTGEPPRIIISRLNLLRLALEDNRRLLSLHMVAAQEIADLVSDALEESASDGTYSAAILRR
jgi:hypothetical protein